MCLRQVRNPPFCEGCVDGILTAGGGYNLGGARANDGDDDKQLRPGSLIDDIHTYVYISIWVQAYLITRGSDHRLQGESPGIATADCTAYLCKKSQVPACQQKAQSFNVGRERWMHETLLGHAQASAGGMQGAIGRLDTSGITNEIVHLRGGVAPSVPYITCRSWRLRASGYDLVQREAEAV